MLVSASVDAQPRCPTTTLTVDDALASGRWRAAVDTMRETLAGTDRPWHCAGASVRFTADAQGAALLEVALPSGTTIRRHIAAPDEVEATLRATLILDALPAIEEPEVRASMNAATSAEAAVERPSASDGSTASPPRGVEAARRSRDGSAARGERTPTAGIEGALEVGARIGSSPSYTSLALRATIAFRIRAWSLFAWVRGEPYTYRLVDRGPGRYLLDVGVLGIGATWGARVLRGRVEVGPTLSTESYSWHDQALTSGQKETYVQVRLGALARWRSHERGVGFTAALDAEVAPLTLQAGASLDGVPSPPLWSVGLMVGVAYGGAQ